MILPAPARTLYLVRGLQGPRRRGMGALSADEALLLQQASEYVRGHIGEGILVCGPNLTPEDNSWQSDPVSLTVASIPHANPFINDPYYAPWSPPHVSADSWAYYYRMAGATAPDSGALGIPKDVGLTMGQYYYLKRGGSFVRPPVTCVQGTALIASAADVEAAKAAIRSGAVTVQLTASPPPAASASPAPAAGGGTLSFVPSRSGGVLQPGDTWTISISGASPNTQVIVQGGKNGTQDRTPMGTTNGSGNFSLSGTITADSIGSWSETWYVGSAVSGAFNFQVVAAGTVATTQGAVPVVPTPAPLTALTAAIPSWFTSTMVDGIPNWALALGAVGVGWFLFGRKQ